MIDETMLPREGLFDRKFSVLAEIRHPNNSTKIGGYQLNQACIVEEIDRKKGAVPVWDCVRSYIYDTNGKLK